MAFSQTSDNQFCYSWSVYSGCFDSKPQAVAAMKAAMPVSYRDVVREFSDVPTGTVSQSMGPQWRIDYIVDDKPPEQMLAPVYLVNGADSRAGVCASSGDPLYPYQCSDGDQAAEEWLRVFGVSSCTYVKYGFVGAYAEPFRSISRYSWSSRYGVIALTPEPYANTRSLSYTITCSAWSDPTPQQRYVPIAKQQAFLCPVEFFPVEGTPATISGPLCRANDRTARITYYQRQTNTCPVGNPCHPATGDKSRNETDFDFAGQSFTRYYHSLAQVNVVPVFAPGWTHTFSDRVVDGGNGGFLTIKSDGYIEYFISIGNNEHVSSQSLKKKLIKLTDGSYRIYEESGRILSFNASGRLVRQELSTGGLNAIDFTYDGDKLILAQDHIGRTLSFQYVANRLDTIVLPDGGVVQYEFDASGNFTRATYPGGTSKQYHYNESGLSLAGDANALTGITTENGHRYGSFGYNAKGRVNLSRLHKGDGTYAATISIDYTNINQPVVTMPTGEVRTYGIVNEGAYRRINSVAGGSGTFLSTYTGGGLSQTVGLGGSTTKYVYDAGYEKTRYEAFGTPEERKTNTVRDTLYRLTSREIQAKPAATYVTRQTQAWTHNARGQVLTATVTDPSTSTSRTITTSYCEQSDVTNGTCPFVGLVKAVDGARTDATDVTSYTYYQNDSSGCIPGVSACSYRKGDLWKVTNALGQESSILGYDDAGRPTSTMDANGLITEMTYNARGWLTARKVRGTSGAVETDDQITLIEYWPTGLVKKVTQPDGAFSSYVYDDAMRLTVVTDSEGNSITYTLDASGERTQEHTKDDQGALMRTLSRTYNTLGQLQTATDAYSRNTGFTYDSNSNLDTTTDALTHVTDNNYDPLDRLKRTLQDMTGIAAETQFKYDVLDNLTQVKDPKGLNTDYTYNGLSDLLQLSSPDTGTTTYTYDSAGNRASQTDARGVTTTYGYDVLDRLTSVAYPTTSLNSSYTYDTAQAACQSGETFSVGRLTKIVDGSGNTVYCYDRFGNLVRKVQATNGKVFTLRYLFNVAGQLTGMVYPDGAVVDYVRDAQGRVTEVGAQSVGGTRQVVLTNATYYPFGPVAEWTYGNNRVMKRSLNQNYQPGFVEVIGAGGLNIGYEFDEVGNLKKLRTANQVDPPLRAFGYDGLNRLTENKDGTTNAVLEGYSYDKTGNRTSATVGAATTAYGYLSGSHRLDSVGATARAYDNVGNTTQIGGSAKEFIYNDLNRMSQYVESGVAKMSYVYNGNGEQVRKYASGTTNEYSLYDESGQWLGEYDDSGAPVQQIVWLDNLPVGVLAGASTSQKLYYVEADALGSPRVVVDPVRGASGTAVWAWDLAGEAFGNTAPNQDPDGDSTQFVFDMRFPGQRFDAVSSVNYNYFRDYEPGTGRYVESDSIGLAGGISTYSYVEAAPLTSFDPSGLAPVVVLPVAARAVAHQVARCTAMYAAYKGAEKNCRQCKQDCSFEDSAAGCACWALVVQLRKNYIRFKCDYFYPGSIIKGSSSQERAHRIELRNKTNARNKCCFRAARAFDEEFL